MSSITPEGLRAAALARVTPHTDPRVVDVLREANFAIEHEVSEWLSSEGRVLAHRVHVGLGAALLGALRGHPHMVDEVTRILSVAMTECTAGDQAGEIAFRHDLGARRAPSLASAYRGDQMPAELTQAAAAGARDVPSLAGDYLAAFGDAEVAAMARRSQIHVTTQKSRGESHHDVRLTLAPEDTGATTSQVVLLEICLRELLCTHASDDLRFTKC